MSLNELTSNDTLKIWRTRINEIISNLKNCAKINHASENKEYGCGDKNKFGHVKLSDSISLSSGVNGGIAATPSAVYEVYKLASSSIRLNEKIVGTLEITEIKGNLIGNAETSTLAEKAIGDELGRTIHETYTTKEELTNVITSLNFNVSSIKRDGTSLQWKDILSDTDSCFLYQNTYVGYMPALNLKTEDGRIGFGTYQDLCRWNYFKNDNQTNTPDSYIDLTYVHAEAFHLL